jgi:hypothetical protein
MIWLHRIDEAWLPGLAPRRTRTARERRLDDDKTLIEIEQVVAEMSGYAEIMRAPDKRGPIDMADIALLIADIEIVLRGRKLPIPDPGWLREFVIETRRLVARPPARARGAAAADRGAARAPASSKPCSGL